MKTNKVIKVGVSLFSMAILGAVAPVLTDAPIFGATVVKAEERGSLNYRISYYDEETGEEIAAKKTGVINPGETINVYKDIDGYEVTTKSSRLPNYEATYDIVARNFHGDPDGYKGLHLDYKKLNPTPTPEPAPTPTPTPEPEVKPEPAPKAEEQKEPLKYRISYYDGETGKEITAKKTGVINPGETVNVYKDIDSYEVTSKDSWMPNYEATYDMVATYFHGDPDGYKGFYLDYKKLDADVKPSETPKPEVKPEPKPSDTPKPEVKPETKPSETPKPEVKPEPKPSDTSKPEVKPAPKPSDTPKPEVKPAPKPSDTSKPEVKPELKPQTNSNTAPTAPVKPVGQDSNTKADKPVSKTETTALPKTGEQNSILGFAGFLLASLGLAGLTYKGRH